MCSDNKLNCDDCKCKVDGAIGDLITDLPSFFLLGFRNVQYQGNRRRGGAVKITVPMRVDETVDLRDFCAPELVRGLSLNSRYIRAWGSRPYRRPDNLSTKTD